MMPKKPFCYPVWIIGNLCNNTDISYYWTVKVKNTAALELKETRFLGWLYMSCRLHLYRFYVGESIISSRVAESES